MKPLPPIPRWLDIPQGDRALAMAMQYQLQRTQHAPPEVMRAWQLAALQRLLAHAVRHVPWYRERLGADFRLDSWASWQALPVLTRAEVQQAGDALASAQVPAEHGDITEVRSSGSTGRPVRVKVAMRCATWWSAITMRDHLWHRRNLAGVLATIKYADPGDALLPGVQLPDWGEASATLFGSGRSYLLSSSVTVDEQFAWLLSLRPDYLLTYPSLAFELAKRNDAADRPLRLSGLSTLGEMLLPHHRTVAEASFGARLIDVYSAQETGYLAMQCPRHDHYHVAAESCLFEILDDDNRPCPPGTAGRVVVTPLHNYAQPLVRYAIGDHAIAGEPCDCGIRLPVVRQLLGRTRNLVLMPDGSTRWPTYQPSKLMQIWPTAQFQVAQTSRTGIELRVAGIATINADERARAIACVRESLEGFDILVRLVDDLPRSAGGKYEEFRCEIPAT